MWDRPTPVTLPSLVKHAVRCSPGHLAQLPIVEAIIEMSHAIGLRVVAEGVSSARLQPLVAALGCGAAQGFFWAEPMPAPEFADW